MAPSAQKLPLICLSMASRGDVVYRTFPFHYVFAKVAYLSAGQVKNFG